MMLVKNPERWEPNMKTIEELLEERDTLFEMAEVLFGENWITTEAFWNSSVNRDLIKNNNNLSLLGYDAVAEAEAELGEEVDLDELRDIVDEIAKRFGFDLEDDEE